LLVYKLKFNNQQSSDNSAEAHQFFSPKPIALPQQNSVLILRRAFAGGFVPNSLKDNA